MTVELKPEIAALIQIANQVQESWDEAQRGEFTGGEKVRAEMRQFKEDWKKLRRSA